MRRQFLALFTLGNLLSGCYLNASISSLTNLDSTAVGSELPKFTGELKYENSVDHFKNQNFSLAPQSNTTLLSNFSINPTLPIGLTINTTTGVIEGVPSQAKSKTTYTITAGDGNSNYTTTVDISVGLKFEIDSNSDTSDLIVGDGFCSDNIGNCTLRAAVEELNSWPAIPREVNIPSMTITLDTSNIDITNGTKITGNGSTNTILQVGVTSMRLFNITTQNTETTSLSNLKIQNGKPNQNGGAILVNSGTLEINDSTFYNNITYSGYYGGAIATEGGDLIIKNSIFDSNQTTTVGSGGALSLDHENNSTLIENSIFVSNHAQRNGGAIYIGGLGGAGSIGTLTIKNTLIENNIGTNRCGGVYISAGNFKISNSLLNQNTGSFGQLYIKDANCSPSDNCEVNQIIIYTATNIIALAFEDFSQFTLRNSTIIGGTNTISPSLYYAGSGIPPNIITKNSIISNPNAGPSCNYNLSSLGYNISSASDCNLSQPTDQTNQLHLSVFTDGNLVNMGGNQKVVEIKNPGPAIDKGPVNCDSTEDIRGTGFLRSVNKLLGVFCDVGAFELQ